MNTLKRVLFMTDENKITTGHIVEEKMLGNTKILICDDYAAKTQEERALVLTHFKECAYKMCSN